MRSRFQSLQSGEALTWRDVWAMAPDASRTWAHDTLRKLYRLQ